MNFTMDNAINIVIIIMLAIYFILGMRRGFIRQIMDIVGVIVAFICAFYFAKYFAEYLVERFSVNYHLFFIISGVAIFIGIILIFRLIGAILRKLADFALLAGLDTIGGGIFGAFKGVLLVSLILVILHTLPLPLPKDFKSKLKENKLAAAIYPVLPWLFDHVLEFIPGEIDFEKSFSKVKDGDSPDT